MKCSRDQSCRLVILLSVGMFLGGCRFTASTISVQGPGTPPHLELACCEHGLESMQRLFADSDLIPSLRELHASVAVAIADLSPQRAAVVHRLNEQGIPVVAWILLPREQGYYLTADNASAAPARVADFEKWTNEFGLRWVAVGLDIEPNFDDLAHKKGRSSLIVTLLRRSINRGRIVSARKVYSTIINQIRSRGFPVQIYQMPYIPAERSAHSSLPDRMLGTVDVGGDQDYLMLYTSFARPIGAGMIWFLGRHAQAIAIGSTDGDKSPGTADGPLDWNEFSRDLILASHFTRQIGVYDLEGCVRQGFLHKLTTMNWSQSVVVPPESVRRAELIGFASRSILWFASNFAYFLLAIFLFAGFIVCRRHVRRTKMARQSSCCRRSGAHRGSSPQIAGQSDLGNHYQDGSSAHPKLRMRWRSGLRLENPRVSEFNGINLVHDPGRLQAAFRSYIQQVPERAPDRARSVGYSRASRSFRQSAGRSECFG